MAVFINMLRANIIKTGRFLHYEYLFSSSNAGNIRIFNELACSSLNAPYYHYPPHWQSVRDEFCLGGLKSLARIFFFHCLHENQVVLPEYYLIFCPKMALWKFYWDLQPPSAHGPCAYAHLCIETISVICIPKAQVIFYRIKSGSHDCHVTYQNISIIFIECMIANYNSDDKWHTFSLTLCPKQFIENSEFKSQTQLHIER